MHLMYQNYPKVSPLSESYYFPKARKANISIYKTTCIKKTANPVYSKILQILILLMLLPKAVTLSEPYIAAMFEGYKNRMVKKGSK